MAEAPANSVHPLSRAEWRAWLDENHKRDEGVWLITYKKATDKRRLEYDEAVEEALCFGWVDSKPSKLDEERSMLWYAPRKAGSGWSRPNKERVERMAASGADDTGRAGEDRGREGGRFLVRAGCGRAVGDSAGSGGRRWIGVRPRRTISMRFHAR